jgi:Protein of unknown function, DUF481
VRERPLSHFLLTTLFVLAFPGGARAQKTDVVLMKNGDRITGEIRSYSNGYVVLDTFFTGFVDVKWNQILSITSDKRFDIETISGTHDVGHLAPSDPPGKLVIVGENQTWTLDFLEVFQLAPVYQKFWRRWDGSLDAGLNYTQSSQLVQVNVNATGTYRRLNHEVASSLSVFYSKQNEAPETSHGTFGTRYDRFVAKRWFGELGIGFDRNLDLGLELRASAYVAGGHNLIQTNRSRLTAYAGISGNREEPVEGDGQFNTEGIIGGRYSSFMYDFPKLTLAAAVAVYPSFTTSGRYRIEASGSAKREIVRDFYVSLSIFDSYDSDDPTTGESRNDWGPSFTLGWQF